MKTIFVSSTFRDMHQERDAIRDITAPILNAEAKKYGEFFSFCDLRWGIDTTEMNEVESEKKILEVCLDEIDRCDLPFVVILGDRYGHVPDERVIQNAVGRKAEFHLKDLEQSVTSLEIEYGALRDDYRKSHALVYIREIQGAVPELYCEENAEYIKKLAELKERIYRFAGNHVRTYSVCVDKTQDCQSDWFLGIREFAEMLADDLLKALRPEWELLADLTSIQKEYRIHENYMKEKCSQFYARQVEAKQLFARIQNQPLTIVCGDSGTGKSTILGYLNDCLKKAGWNTLVIACGQTPRTSTASGLLDFVISWLQETLPQVELTTSEVMVDRRDDRIAEKNRRLEFLCHEYVEDTGRLMIIIDAVDQLLKDDIRDQISFIFRGVQGKVHTLLSCISMQGIAGNEVYYLKPLDIKSQREVIEGIYGYAQKQLSGEVVQKILSLKSSENPLFLHLLTRMLAIMGKEDFLQIQAAGGDIDAINQYQIQVIDKIKDYSVEEIGAELIMMIARRTNMFYAVNSMAVSRHGVRRKDLEDLTLKMNKTWHLKWSDLSFVQLVNYLSDCFICREDGRYDFSHVCIRKGLRNNLGFEDKSLEKDYHFFLVQNVLLPECMQGINSIWENEIIYHLIRADKPQLLLWYILYMEFANAISATRDNADTSNGHALTAAAEDLRICCFKDNGWWIANILEKNCLLMIRDQEIVSESVGIALLHTFICFRLSLIFRWNDCENRIYYRILRAWNNLLETVSVKTTDYKKEKAECLKEQLERCSSMGDRKHLREGIAAAEKALEYCDGEDDNDRIRILSEMAHMYEEKGGYANQLDALLFCEKVLSIWKKMPRNKYEPFHVMNVVHVVQIYRRILDQIGRSVKDEWLTESLLQSLEGFFEGLVSDNRYKDFVFEELPYLYRLHATIIKESGAGLEQAEEYTQKAQKYEDIIDSLSRQNKDALIDNLDHQAKCLVQTGNRKNLGLALQCWKNAWYIESQKSKEDLSRSDRMKRLDLLMNLAKAYVSLRVNNSQEEAVQLLQKRIELLDEMVLLYGMEWKEARCIAEVRHSLILEGKITFEEDFPDKADRISQRTTKCTESHSAYKETTISWLQRVLMRRAISNLRRKKVVRGEDLRIFTVGREGEFGEFVIPDNIEEIGENAFRGHRGFNKIVGQAVEIIGRKAFEACGVKIVLFPSVKRIEEEAFYSSEIKAIRIGHLESIGQRAFAYCGNIERLDFTECPLQKMESEILYGAAIHEILLPDSLTKIGRKAFFHVKGMKNIVFPESLCEIDESAFELCEQLESVEFKGEAILIREAAFRDCTRLHKIDCSHLIAIGKRAFSECGLRKININGLTSITEKSFFRNKYLEKVELSDDPNAVIEIKERAFELCYALWNINLHRVSMVGESAFSNTALQEIIFDDVPTLGKEAFSQCDELEHVEICRRRIQSNEKSVVKGKEVLKFGARIWSACRNLKTISVLWDGPVEIAEDAFDGNRAMIICLADSPIFYWLKQRGIENVFTIDNQQDIKIQAMVAKQLFSVTNRSCC